MCNLLINLVFNYLYSSASMYFKYCSKPVRTSPTAFSKVHGLRLHRSNTFDKLGFVGHKQ